MSDSIVCHFCGHPNSPENKTCAKCGVTLQKPQDSPDKPSAEKPKERDVAERAADSSPTLIGPASEGAKTCPTCGTVNRIGIVFCENCGTNLLTGEPPAGTRSVTDVSEAELDAAAATVQFADDEEHLPDGTSQFDAGMKLRIQIMMSRLPLTITPEEGKEIVLGRLEATTDTPEAVNFTPYAAYPLGVSRRHASLKLSGNRLEIRDLASNNGTFLNGTQIWPDEVHVLRSGDTIRLARMKLQVYFEKA